MTNKEAMEIMKGYREKLTNSCANNLFDDIEAFNIAIEALDNIDELCENLAFYINERNRLLEERPTGEWLEWVDERWGGVWHYCSNCHNDALYKKVDGIFKQILSDFCPYCGVKMKGGEEE